MLHLWIGRAGAGKTARVLETIKKNRTRRGQILIVPEHVSHEAEVALCHALGDTASRNAEVLSLRNLSGRVLGEVGGLSDFTLDGGGKLLTMRMALQEVGSSLHVFNNPSRRAAFLEQLVALVDELYAYEIPPQELYAQVQDVPGTVLQHGAYAVQCGGIRANVVNQFPFFRGQTGAGERAIHIRAADGGTHQGEFADGRQVNG